MLEWKRNFNGQYFRKAELFPLALSLLLFNFRCENYFSLTLGCISTNSQRNYDQFLLQLYYCYIPFVVILLRIYCNNH